MPMNSVDVGHRSFLSASSAYHSCTGDTLSENYDQDSVYSSYSREAEDDFKEPEVITKKHYDTLGRSLANRPRLEPANFRSDAREKIARLTRVQFLELAMDVHDEVARTNSKQKNDFVPSSGNSCHPHRHEARQKIAKLHPNVLKGLMSDIFYELGRRYPKFKEAETLPEQTGVSRSKNNSPCEFKLDAITPMNLNFFDIDEDSSAGSGTREGEHSTRLPDIISRSMSISQVVSVLEDHGCPNITDKIDLSTCSSTPVAGGGFGDVYHGILRNGSEVAIKCARVFATDAELGRMDFKSAASELYAWSKYRHRNVVELLGLAHFRDRIAMVSPWMTNGTLNQYLKRFPSADRCRICSDIASGLSYLHQMGTIHGDVKGLNVLFSSDGTAKLIDFGNSALRSSTLQFTGSHAAPTFSTRWTAPELLVGSGAYTLEGDVYALGMTILEVISGEIPFPEIKSDVAVMGRVLLQKMPPDRPQTSIPMMSKQGNILWKLLEECWSYDPQARPQASHVQSQVSQITCEGLKTFSLTDQDWFERFIPDISQSLGMSLN